MVVAAIDAVIDVVSRGTSFERAKLIEADVFEVAVELYESGLCTSHSLKLLDCLVKHSSQAIAEDEKSVETLLGLFEWVRVFGMAINTECCRLALETMASRKLCITHWSTFYQSPAMQVFSRRSQCCSTQTDRASHMSHIFSLLWLQRLSFDY